MFRMNEFQTYKTTSNRIAFGFVEGGYTPELGETIQYDGNTVILQDGRKFENAPQLRGAIAAGWFVLDAEASSSHARLGSRSPQPSKAPERQSVFPTVRAEDNIVAELRKSPGSSHQTAIHVQKSHQEGIDDLLGELDFLLSKTTKTSKWDRDLEALFRNIELGRPIRPVVVSPTVQPPVVQPPVVQPPVVQPSSAQPQMVRGMSIERDEQLRMPLVREDPTETGGSVIATITPKTTMVSGSAAVNAPTPAPVVQKTARFGEVGGLIVDEERDLGRIGLSNRTTAPTMDVSAKATVTSSSIKMATTTTVGRQMNVTNLDGDQEQVLVGRVLTPAHQKTVLNAATSMTVVDRAEKIARVELLNPKPQPTATGDVSEPLSGDTLEELLPNAIVASNPAEFKAPEHPEFTAAMIAARELVPNFTWNINRPTRERVQEALTHVEDTQYMRAILTVETKICRDEIRKEIQARIDRQKAAEEAEESEDSEA